MSDTEQPCSKDPSESSPANFAGLILYRCSVCTAYFGGFVLMGLVAINAASIVGRTLFANPLVGDFELVELGCAIAISSFLPICYLREGNVTVDFFSSKFPKQLLTVLALITDLIFMTVGVTFSLRMSLGIQDFLKYGEETMLLQIPIWIPFIPVLLSFYLLTACAVYNVGTRFSKIPRINS